ncbi:MAG: DUF87 domain-containing protein [Oscillospiraceae bacterium]|nr:DUF87 domain-containing protein [Oscillospiraceae bacterium]
MNSYYPAGTVPVLHIGSLSQTDGRPLPPDGLSSRVTRCAAVLPSGGFIGWQMTVRPGRRTDVSLFGSAGVTRADLEWIAERTGQAAESGAGKSTPPAFEEGDELYELYLPAAEPAAHACVRGFAQEPAPISVGGHARWPLGGSAGWSELPEALSASGGTLRVTVGPADAGKAEECRRLAARTFPGGSADLSEYVGTPTSVRVLLRLPCAPSLRLRACLGTLVRGTDLRYLGRCADGADGIWKDPLDGARVLPEVAARLMILEPSLSAPVAGLPCRIPEPPVYPLTVSGRAGGKGVRVGTATDESGSRRRVTLGDADLCRHYQIVGQTGTGKSTLLTGLILSAVSRGCGLTFFDPHGSTIDAILRSVPEKYAHRIRVVRIGDSSAPVPLSLWDSDDPEKEERTISDLCQLFGSIFDPPGECFTGPRYERWLGTFARASIALLGRRASLESIAVLSRSRDTMNRLADAVDARFPDLAETIRQEYVRDHSSDFHATLSWYLCKFQRLTSVEQLRATLGAGTNALDPDRTIDTDTVTLIDLSVPVIGTQAARIVGTVLLMKLWSAAQRRKQRERPHLVVIDEASLFQTEPLPRMLAESRKFGLSLVLCHQHMGQLSSAVREALEANSASFSAFRTSPRDAAAAALRLDDPALQAILPRLPSFRAVTTLSTGGILTPPFTLSVRRPAPRKDGAAVAARIEAESVRALVEPYRDLRALTPREILERLDRALEASAPVFMEAAEDPFADPLPDALAPAALFDGASPAASIPIERLDLSTRSYLCLKRAGLDTVEAVRARGTLTGIRNLGSKSIAEIEAKLREFTPAPASRTA